MTVEERIEYELKVIEQQLMEIESYRRKENDYDGLSLLQYASYNAGPWVITVSIPFADKVFGRYNISWYRPDSVDNMMKKMTGLVSIDELKEIFEYFNT